MEVLIIKIHLSKGFSQQNNLTIPYKWRSSWEKPLQMEVLGLQIFGSSTRVMAVASSRGDTAAASCWYPLVN